MVIRYSSSVPGTMRMTLVGSASPPRKFDYEWAASIAEPWWRAVRFFITGAEVKVTRI